MAEKLETIEMDAETNEDAAESGADLIEILLEHAARTAKPLPERIDGIVVGKLVRFGTSGEISVTFPGCPDGGMPARAMATLTHESVGQDVGLLFEGGDPRKPVIMGMMHVQSGAAETSLTATSATVHKDGERIEISAEQEIVLRTGQASITLTRAGKIILRGTYLLSRSSGVHRIQGGSVQIN